MQQLYAWSGLGRSLSWHHTTNRLIILCTGATLVLAAGIAYANNDGSLKNALITGFSMAGAVFLSWALARELQPDAPGAAFVAVAICSLNLLFWTDPALLLLFYTLLICRFINRSTGIPASVPDLLVLLCCCGWLLYQGALMAGLLAAAAFWSNSRLPAPQPQHKFLILPVLIATFWAIAYHPMRSAPAPLSTGITFLVMILATVFALIIRKSRSLTSVADATGEPLSLKRVRAGQIILLLSATVFSLWFGDAYFGSLSPLWAAFAGIFLFNTFSRTTPQKQA